MAIKHLSIVQWRQHLRNELEAKQFDSSAEAQAFVDSHRDTAQLDATGKVVAIKRGDWDWFIQHHITIETSAETQGA